MWWVTGSALVLLAMVLYVPWLRSLVSVQHAASGRHRLVPGRGLAGGVWFEAVKRSIEAGRALLLARGQRLVQIPQDVVEIFQADRQADHVGFYAGGLLLLGA